MMSKSYLHSDITEKIIKAFYRVYNNLGFGFLERVYVNALVIELIKEGLSVKVQQPIKVFYEGKEIGLYIADLVINDCVILEIKAAEALCEEHEAQLLNYLKATEIEVGLLLNFGKKAELKRKVFSSEFKPLSVKNHDIS
jgi:GxxExxY protein